MTRLALCLLITACGSSRSGVTCGEGTEKQDGQCVAVGGSGQGGGAASTAGEAQGGSAYSVCPEPLVLGADQTLIADFENGAIGWLGSHDQTGTVMGTGFGSGTESNAGELEGSTAAAHFHGAGLTDWGASLYNLGWSNSCIDATAFSGISFWAKGGPGTGDTLQSTLSVQIVIPMTLPADNPGAHGECTIGCYDHYKVLQELSEEWQEFSFVWDDMTQSGWGRPVPFTPHRMMTLQFATAVTSTEGISFDFWIDQIEFVAP